jgi:hypothetical protein
MATLKFVLKAAIDNQDRVVDVLKVSIQYTNHGLVIYPRQTAMFRSVVGGKEMR